jgi:hypothetical protein
MKTVRVVMMVVLVAAIPATAAELSFGGDLKFHLFDVSSGSSTLPELDTLGNIVGVKYDTTDRWTMGFERAYLFFSVQVNDRVSVDIQPELVASSGATPQLGMRIGAQRGTNPGELGVSFNAASVGVALPWDAQLSAGILRPQFTEDYGEMKGFQEENRYGKTGANPWLGAWHDMGLELYRPFEIQVGDQYLTIPAYLYLLNGTPPYLDIPATDNNNNKMAMVHVAPEFWKLRLIGSFGYGKWDDAGENTVMRYAGGIGAEFGPVWLRAEYMGGQWDGQQWLRSYEPYVVDTFAAKPFGYYAKLGVNIIPDKLRFVLHYDYARHNFDGFYSVGSPDISHKYTTVSGTLGWSVAPGSSVMLGVEKAMWQTSDGLRKLDYWRPTLGWRTVF